MRNTSTIPEYIFIYGYSLGVSSSEQLMHLDTTIVSLFYQKKKKSKRRRKKKKRKKREIRKIKKRKEKEKQRGDILLG